MSDENELNVAVVGFNTPKNIHHIEFFGEYEIDIIEENGENYFKLKNVMAAIEYENISNALRLISEEYCKKINVYNTNQNKFDLTWYITEFGIYEFVMKAKSEKAKTFQKWVYEVIHTIRKTGSYSLQPQQNINADLAAILTAMQNGFAQIVTVIQSESQITRTLIEAKYNTIDNLVNHNSELSKNILANQDHEKKQQIIKEYTDQIAQAKVEAFSKGNNFMKVSDFAESIGKKCTNSTEAGNIIIKANFEFRHRKGCRAFKVEDLKLFYDWHPHMFVNI